METVIVNGVERHCGLIPSSAESIARMHREGTLSFSHRKFGAMRAPDNWVESDCSHFWKYRKIQTGNSCVGHSGGNVLGVAYAKEGFDVNINPMAVYAPICDGVDQGAMMSDCLDALQKYGAFLSGEGGIGDLDWRAAYKSKFWQNPTSALGASALKRRIVEAVFCSSVDDFIEGIQRGGWTGQFGMGVGNNFDTDADGWMPKCDGATINHALMATGGMKKNPKTGIWGLEAGNSWSRFGLNGIFYFDPYDWLPRRGNELWLVRSTIIAA